MRFIHAADLHIDSPLRGLDRYAGAPVERLRGATRRAMERLVDLAIDEAVDFVILAGDVYDRDWQDFHTGLFFREQMVRLNRAGIRVFIAQGNHDAQGVISRQLTLPDNVSVFPSRSAQTLRPGDLPVAIHGRSFPDRQVDEDWVPDYPPPVADRFNIGVLHTSLNGRVGHDPYAPTQIETLVSKGYDYWALGHVHARELVCESPRIVFPGNLQGRHARETGPKGCELVRVEAGRIQAEFVELDVVRWHQVGLDLDGVASLSAIPALFRDRVRPLLQAGRDRLHVFRVHCLGASALADLEARRPGSLDAAIRGAAQDLDGAEVWIEKVRLQLAPPFDRVSAAAREDAVGELVRMVDRISADPQALRDLVSAELAPLLERMPTEFFDGDVLDPEDHEALRRLLVEAEATVLARLRVVGEGE